MTASRSRTAPRAPGWDGCGIVTSQADATLGVTGLAVAEASDVLSLTGDGPPSIAAERSTPRQ
jgi:hypothetical protein